MTTPAEASMMLNPVALFMEADPVVKAVMIGLVVASLQELHRQLAVS